jgi:hypothetical protein
MRLHPDRLSLLALLAGYACQSSAEAPRDAVPRARVVSTAGAAPAFAAEPEPILKELEAWRGRGLLADLVVEFVPRAKVGDAKLNGWYEPSTGRLVVVEGAGDAMGRGVLYHELFHALQDQHFDLVRLHELAAGSTDAEHAVSALIEGEAMLAVSELLNYDFEQHAKLPAEGPLDPERFEKIFHYGAGLRFVRALRAAGGWARVDEAFREPPLATAEILHPETFLAGSRAAAEAELEQAWTRAALPADRGAPLGEYELQRFLAGAPDQRARAAELAATFVAGRAKALADGRAAWYVLARDEAGARALLTAAVAAGAQALVPQTAEPRLVAFEVPAS